MSTINAGQSHFTVKGQSKQLTFDEANEFREVMARLGMPVEIEEVRGTVTANLELSLDEDLQKKFDRICTDAGVVGDKDANLEAAVLFLVKRYRSTVGNTNTEVEHFSVSSLTVPQIDAGVVAGVISEQTGDLIKSGKLRIGPKNINALKEWLAKS